MHYSELVQESINFMNQNLTEDVSLETLAGCVHFSPYHFHRLFLLIAGEPPMEYFRRLRLRAASRELLLTKVGIIEISEKYRFESQDGFSRAFKKYYGVTPGEYRRINFKIQNNCTKSLKGVENIMYDMNIYEKLICSENEKKEAFEILDKILQMAEKAKCNGLLSLEPEIDIVDLKIFKKSIQLLIDGIEPKTLKEILLNYIICSNSRGKELLTRILIVEGMLAIQQGVHPLILRERLSSFFGDDFICEINKHFGVGSEFQQKTIESYIAVSKDRQILSKETSLLEEPLGRMDNRSLQRLLRDIDEYTLVNALYGTSGKTQAKILVNVSKKLALLLIDEINSREIPNVSEITDSQKHIIEIMHSLRSQGDILI